MVQVMGAAAEALAAVLPLAAAAAAAAVLPGTSSAKSRLTDLVCAFENGVTNEIMVHAIYVLLGRVPVTHVGLIRRLIIRRLHWRLSENSAIS